MEMVSISKNNKICEKGHHYYKTSDCPTCPVCEAENKPHTGLLSILPAPARRALENKGIETASDLAKYSQAEIASLHGIGPSSLPKFLKELAKYGLSFKES